MSTNALFIEEISWDEEGEHCQTTLHGSSDDDLEANDNYNRKRIIDDDDFVDDIKSETLNDFNLSSQTPLEVAALWPCVVPGSRVTEMSYLWMRAKGCSQWESLT